MTLTCSNVSKSYGAITAVDGVSMQFEPGTIYGLIGPNGAGKTTFFDLLSGFQSPETGEIVLKDVDVTDWPPYKRSKHGLCRTFQNVSLFPGLTVLENLYVSHPSSLREQLRSEPSEAVEERALELLGMLDLTDKRDELASDLSVGQKKLVEFCTLIMTEPEFVLFDEPVAGVNPTLINEIGDFIEDMRANAGVTPIIVEHNMEFVMNLCEEILVLNQGRILTSGPPSAVQTDQTVLDVYLGGS